MDQGPHGGRNGGDDDEQVAYCTDEDGEIVDDDFCDGYDGGGLFFLYVRGLRAGLPLGTAPGCRRAVRGSTPVVLSRYLLPAYLADQAPPSWRSHVRRGPITDNLSYFVPHTIDYRPPRAGRSG